MYLIKGSASEIAEFIRIFENSTNGIRNRVWRGADIPSDSAEKQEKRGE